MQFYMRAKSQLCKSNNTGKIACQRDRIGRAEKSKNMCSRKNPIVPEDIKLSMSMMSQCGQVGFCNPSDARSSSATVYPWLG